MKAILCLPDVFHRTDQEMQMEANVATTFGECINLRTLKVNDQQSLFDVLYDCDVIVYFHRYPNELIRWCVGVFKSFNRTIRTIDESCTILALKETIVKPR